MICGFFTANTGSPNHICPYSSETKREPDRVQQANNPHRPTFHLSLQPLPHFQMNTCANTKISVNIKFMLLCMVFFGAVCATQAQTNTRVLPAAEYYTGGQEKLMADIQRMIEYPPTAKRNRMQGECLVNFVLEADGKIANQKLVKEIGGGCGAEALRVVSQLKFNAPGYRMDVGLPIKFSLPKPGGK